MKNPILAIIVALMAIGTVSADNSTAIINKVANTYKALKGISADYAITTDQGTSAGSIVMQGDKFRMLSNDLRCWFNGKQLWSYSSMSGEVNITEPSPQDLQMLNPYSIIDGFQKNFTAKQLKSGTASNHEVEMIPIDKKGSDIKSVRITVSRKTYLPTKLIFALHDGSFVTIVMSNYKGGANYPASTFVFSKELVPAGTAVIDLR